MGNTFSSCCPSRETVVMPSLQDDDAEKAEAVSSGGDEEPQLQRISCCEYMAGSWDVFYEIWPAATSFGMEAYEYSLFSLAITQITPIFFADSTLLAWLCYAVPFFTRPFGGTFAGYMMDSYGRKGVVVATAYGVLTTTVVQGLVPSQLGSAGGIILVVLRVLQGLAFGATSSMSVYAGEMSPQGGLSKGVMFLFIGAAIGSMSSTTMFASLNSYLSADAMQSWGWRVPYLVVIIPGLWAAINSHNLSESPDYVQVEEQREEDVSVLTHFKNIFTEYPLNILLFVGVNIAASNLTYVSKTYLISWLPTYAGVPQTFTMWVLWMYNVTFFAGLPFMAYLTDQYGAAKVGLIGYSASIMTTLPMYGILLTGSDSNFWAAALEFISGAAGSLTLATTVLSNGMLPTEIRSTTAGLLNNIVSCFFGGLSPALLTWLSTFTPMAPAYYLTFGQALTLLGLILSLVSRNKGYKLSYMREEPF